MGMKKPTNFSHPSLLFYNNHLQTFSSWIFVFTVSLLFLSLRLNSDSVHFWSVDSSLDLYFAVLGPVVLDDSFMILPSKYATNNGVMFDSVLNFEPHIITNICKSCYSNIRNIYRIGKFLCTEHTKILVNAFVTSRLDNNYCNSLLYGLPDHCLLHTLQLTQNCAARLIFKVHGYKYDHIMPLPRELHWLPVEHLNAFKLLLITFKALNNLAPCYVSNLVHLHTPNRLSRSSSKLQLQIPPSNLKTYGDHAFSVCAPKLWNCLPDFIRHSPSVSTFKSSLKTYLFKQYFIY